MSGTLNDLLAQYGYLFLAVFLFIESIGIPIPGETALVTAAALAGGGRLSIVGVFMAAVLGTVTGGMTGYWIGERGGQAIVLRFGRALRVNEERLARAEMFFDRHGASAVVIGRFIAVIRSYLGIFAGVAAMPPKRFAVYNAIGGLIWSLGFSAVGYLFGKNIPAMMRDLSRVSLVLALVLALVILLMVMWRWFAANGARVLSVMEARWQRRDARPWVVGLREKHPTIWRFFLFRFVRGEYLAMHLLVGWMVSAAAILAFGALTEDVVEGAPLTRADVVLANRLATLAGAKLLAVLRVMGGIGGAQTVGLLVLVVALFLVTRRDWLVVGTWIGGYVGSLGLDMLLRRIVRRVALPHLPNLVPNDLAQLPTGHTVEAVLVFGLIAHLLSRRAPSGVLRVLIVFLTLALLGTIVAARLFLGSSYLSTESASVAAGVIWLAAAISGLELAKHRRESIELTDDDL